MPVSRAETGRGDPEEWQAGAKTARFARQRTANRIGEMIVESDQTGSKDLLAQRLRELIAAERSGDPLVVHGALMELASAAGARAVGLQLETPVFSAELQEAMKGKRNGNGNGNGRRTAAAH
jgi:hypothetical protein